MSFSNPTSQSKGGSTRSKLELIKPSGANQATELRAHNDGVTRARQRTVHCYKCNVDHISSETSKWQTALVGTSKGKNTVAESKNEVNFEEAKMLSMTTTTTTKKG